MINAEQNKMDEEHGSIHLFSIHNSSFIIRPFFTILIQRELLE